MKKIQKLRLILKKWDEFKDSSFLMIIKIFLMKDIVYFVISNEEVNINITNTKWIQILIKIILENEVIHQ